MVTLQSPQENLILSSRKTFSKMNLLTPLFVCYWKAKCEKKSKEQRRTKLLASDRGILFTVFQASLGERDASVRMAWAASAKRFSYICTWLIPCAFHAPDSHSLENHKMTPALQANKTITRGETGRTPKILTLIVRISVDMYWKFRLRIFGQNSEEEWLLSHSSLLPLLQ